MKIQLIVVGKTSTSYIKDAIETYVSRIKHYVPFEIKTINDVKNTRKLSEEQQKAAEGDLILSILQTSDYVILLDERGKESTSREFARFIERRISSSSNNIIFVVGGPYGFSKNVFDRANEKLSLSRMTFSHEMVRLFFVEQIYRAMTIIRGEPYHQD